MAHRMEKDLMAASVTDSQALESGGFRSTGRGKGKFPRRGTTMDFGQGGGIVMGA